MKRKFFLLSIIIVISGWSQQLPASSKPNPHMSGFEIGFFFSTLSPHGEWIELEAGFRVWRPLHMHHRWRPYLLGSWTWTDYGWYWMSEEPFGWVTYHYGRWYCDEYYGWVWMPDDVWGPAWVEWRYDNTYIGWAPLPPYAQFHVSFGIHYTTHWDAPFHYWNFIHYNRFGSVLRYSDVAPAEHARRLIRTSRSSRLYEMNHDRIINRGVDRSVIERRGRIRIANTEVRDVREQSGERMIRNNGTARTQRIEVYRPSQDEMRRGAERVETRRGDRALSIDMSKVERTRTEPPTERQQREQRIQEPQSGNRTMQRAPQQQERQQRELRKNEQPRENKPRVQDQQNQQKRKEMRRELMQRYEQTHTPSPPALQKAPQRSERSRQNAPSMQNRESTEERRSGSRRR